MVKAFQCAGCERTFKNKKALTVHSNHCSQLDEQMAALAQAVRERDEASKLARHQGTDVGEERQSGRQENDHEGVSR
jgi:hypothetical protein